jgi:hypothetical protein
MGLQLGSSLTCSINMRSGLGERYTSTRHHVTTLAVTSYRPNLEILVAREVLAHPHTVFHPCTCGLRRCAAASICYDDVRLLSRRSRGGDDRDRLLLPLYRCTTMLDRYSNSSSVVLHLVIMIYDLLLTSFLR